MHRWIELVELSKMEQFPVTFVPKRRRTAWFLSDDGEPELACLEVSPQAIGPEKQELLAFLEGFTRSHAYQREELLKLYRMSRWARMRTLLSWRTSRETFRSAMLTREMSKATPAAVKAR